MFGFGTWRTICTTLRLDLCNGLPKPTCFGDYFGPRFSDFFGSHFGGQFWVIFEHLNVARRGSWLLALD